MGFEGFARGVGSKKRQDHGSVVLPFIRSEFNAVQLLAGPEPEEKQAINSVQWGIPLRYEIISIWRAKLGECLYSGLLQVSTYS